jgi:uncharacterized repeat protein (TIGR01451 family)
MLTDILPPGLDHASGKDRLSWILGNLAPGRSESVEYQVTARKVGRLNNKAIATAAGGFRQEKENSVVIGEAKLELTMAGPRKRYVNMPASYQITVTNQGAFPLDNIVITNPLPAQATFVSASQGGVLEDNLVHWSIGTLQSKESRSVALVLQAQSAGTIRNRATATADRGLTAIAEIVTEFAGISALSLEVADTEDPVEVGGTTSYNIVVRNQGTTPVTRVRISATVPDQLLITQAAGAADNQKQGQRITYEPLTLPAGGEARYRVDVKAQRPGDVRFKVELTADQLTAGSVEQEESTTIYSPLRT